MTLECVCDRLAAGDISPPRLVTQAHRILRKQSRIELHLKLATARPARIARVFRQASASLIELVQLFLK